MSPGLQRIGKNIDAGDRHRAVAWRQETGDHPNRGGLAGAVGTQQAENLSFAYRKRDLVEGREATVVSGEMDGFEHLTGYLQLLGPVAVLRSNPCPTGLLLV